MQEWIVSTVLGALTIVMTIVLWFVTALRSEARRNTESMTRSIASTQQTVNTQALTLERVETSMSFLTKNMDEINKWISDQQQERIDVLRTENERLRRGTGNAA